MLTIPKLLYSFLFKKAFFNFNFVNKVKMYVLPFKISDRKTTAFFFLKGLRHTYTNESFNLPKMGISLFCIEQKVSVTGKTCGNS